MGERACHLDFSAIFSEQRSANERRCPVLYSGIHFFPFWKNDCNGYIRQRRWIPNKRKYWWSRTRRITGLIIAAPFTFTRRNNRFAITSDKRGWASRSRWTSHLVSIGKKKYDDRIYYSTRRTPTSDARHEETRQARRVGCTFVFRRRVSHRERSRLECCC